jgi:hypothetical protein
VTARYDIQSGEEGTFIVRKDGRDWTKIAAFIPHEYTAADESILGSAYLLADALEEALEAHDCAEPDACAFRQRMLAALGKAGRPLPEKPLCISCGEPATEKAGKGGGTGSDLCARCWRDEFSDPGAGD